MIEVYHGGTEPIKNPLVSAGREGLDFGKGFYMGTNQNQVKSLVSNDPNPYYYRLELNIDCLDKDRVLQLTDMDWAYFVLFNRG